MLTPHLHGSLFTYSCVMIPAAVIVVTMVLRNNKMALQPDYLAFTLAVRLRACDDGQVTQ